MNHHEIEYIDIKTLKHHILSKVSVFPNTITIYHFIIGSKAYERDFTEESLSTQTERPRNHECPKIVENLLFNPDLQLSPDLVQNKFKKNKDITIKQILYLIDPSYINNPNPVGLLSVINGLPLELTIEHNLEHINIKSILEPIIVPCDITESHILELISTLNSVKHIYPILINIMDCTSNTCTNLYANGMQNDIQNGLYSDEDNLFHITKPKCLIDDSDLQYIPMICLDTSMIDSDFDFESESEPIVKSLFEYNMLNVRWVNYKNDALIINNMKPDVYLNCPYSKNLFDLVTRLYKVETFEYSLYSINKLWGVTTYTINYTFTINDSELSFDRISNNSSNNSSNKQITINFSKLTFEEFVRFWKYKGFKELPPFNYDYDFIIFCKFINYFIEKYNNGIGHSHLGLNPSIVDFLKVEAFEIFSTLVKYFPCDNKYLSSGYQTVSRESIKKYLIENGCSF